MDENQMPLEGVQSAEPKKKFPLWGKIFIALVAIGMTAGIAQVILLTFSAEPIGLRPDDCTADTRICPDGSSVGRVPPDCTFAPCRETSSGNAQELLVLEAIDTNWTDVQTQFENRPTVGQWDKPDRIQFIGEESEGLMIDSTDLGDVTTLTLLIGFGDGHVGHVVIVGVPEMGFEVKKVYLNTTDFPLDEWNSIVAEYGSEDYEISTYSIGVLREGELVSFERPTKIQENVFLKNYWESEE